MKNHENGMQQLDQPYSDAVEKVNYLIKYRYRMLT